MRYLQETIICFLLGGVPCVWAFYDNGVAGVVKFVESIDTSDRTVMYFLTLAVFHFAVSIIWCWAPRFYQRLKVAISSILTIANGVGSSLLCIYRIIAGASTACVFVLLSDINGLGDVRVLIGLLITSIVFLLMSYFVSKTFDYANEKQQVGS